MVELRKRPAREEPPPPLKKSTSKKAKKDEELAPPVPAQQEEEVKAKSPAAPGIAPAVDDSIKLADFGGEVETNDRVKTTLAKLVDDSKAGVVLFTYPKASTPGCTTQVCLFRDAYEPLTATGLSIYGLSNDSPKANTTFKTKQNLPYPLLCDPSQTLISAIGLKKAPKGTTRGVFVVDKSGRVLASEPGGPAATVDVVKALIAKMGGDSEAKGVQKAQQTAENEAGEQTAGETAAEVADTAATMDKSKTSTPLPS